MPIVLITGITGFIGTHLASHLSNLHWEVHGLIRQKRSLRDLSPFNNSIKFHSSECDIDSLIEIMKRVKPDLVIHLACFFISEHKSVDIPELISGNITFGTNLLEAMKFSKINKLINIGTDWQHFEAKHYSPYSLYAAMKQSFQDILVYYSEVCSINYLTIELGETYGPEDLRPKILSLLRQAALSGEALELSKGEQWLDLLHVKDIVRGIEIAGSFLLRGEIINKTFRLSSSKLLTLRQLVELYSSITGKKMEVLWGEKRYRSRERWNPWTYGIILPKWEPEITINEGIKEFHYHLTHKSI